jgi:hypothetical protein
MQEAPPSPTIPPSGKHRLRLYISGMVLLLVVSSLIWLTVAFISVGDWAYCLGPAYVAGITIFISTKYLPRLNSRARIETLICEFDQISDLFARPKVYRHKSLRRDLTAINDQKCFLYGLSVDSDGSIRMPKMTDTPENSQPKAFFSITNDYGVTICINDDIVHVRKGVIEDRYTNNKLWLIRYFEKHAGKGQKIAHLRISKSDKRSDVVEGDFTIEGDEFEAFMKTLELLKHFNVTPGFQP